MPNGLIRKGLVFSVIVLFIGVGIQPAFAEDNKEQKTDVENGENEKSIGRGTIICQTRARTMFDDFYLPMPRVLISCQDLDTGRIRFGFTLFYGLHFFMFLPLGHDYKLNAYPLSEFDGEQIVSNLTINVAIFTINA